MYFKKFLLILILLIFIFLFNRYYINNKSLSRSLAFNYEIIPIILINQESFDTTVGEKIYSRYLFDVYSFGEFYINSESEYIFNTPGIKDITIEVRNKRGSSKRNIRINVKEKPVEYVEIIKEVEVIKEITHTNNEHSYGQNDVIEEGISGIKDISLKKDCDINELSYLLSKDIRANGNVSIDFTDVNLSKCGIYQVFYYYNDNIYSCYVTVYE